MLGEATAHQREPGCTTPRCMVASTLHYRVATCLVKDVKPYTHSQHTHTHTHTHGETTGVRARVEWTRRADRFIRRAWTARAISFVVAQRCTHSASAGGAGASAGWLVAVRSM